jgi:hypothetical protein
MTGLIVCALIAATRIAGAAGSRRYESTDVRSGGGERG